MASVMAQSHVNSGLAAFDDNMEISSDAGRQADDDIDIDIDVPPNDGNDDDMVDDNTDVQDDDVMFDEDRTAQIVEEHMEEDIIEYQDEELNDVDLGSEGDPEYLTENYGHFQSNFQNPEAGGTLEQNLSLEDDRHGESAVAFVNNSQVGDVDLGQLDNAQGPGHIQESEDETAEEVPELDKSDQELKEPDQAAKQLDLSGADLAAVLDDSAEVDTGITEQQNVGTRSVNEESIQAQSLANVSASGAESNSPSHERTSILQDKFESMGKVRVLATEVPSKDNFVEGEISEPHALHESQEDVTSSARPNDLHPVIVVWEEDEVPLFSLDDASEFFLADASLASSHLRGLFTAFRQVLGDECDDQSDLCFEFDPLGLVIDENMSQIFDSTLIDIVDVYLQLQRNGGNKEPEPLRLILTTKETSTARFASLRQAAAQGMDMSQIRSYPELSEVGFDLDAQENETDEEHASSITLKEEETTGVEHQFPKLTAELQTRPESLLFESRVDDSFQPHEANPSDLVEEVDAEAGDGPDQVSDSGRNGERAGVDEPKEGLESVPEFEYNGEDFLDDTDVPEFEQEESNATTQTWTALGNDFQSHVTEESNAPQRDTSGEDASENPHFELDAEIHEEDYTLVGQQDSIEQPIARPGFPKEPERLPRPSGTGDSLGFAEEQQVYKTADTENIIHDEDHNIDDENRVESAVEPQQHELQRALKSKVAKASPEASVSHESKLLADDEPLSQYALDIERESSDVQNEEDDLSTIGDKDESIELNAQDEAIGEDYPELDDQHDFYEDSKVLADASSNAVRKRSRSDHENGQYGRTEGNDAKKARPR